ncbi:hypothetical protein YPPY46_4273, partial [Yersinia pestis PY-46]
MPQCASGERNRP